jgi:hypothetical protein
VFGSALRIQWTRPNLYRTHLENRHPNVNPDEVLGKPAGSRRRSMIVGRDLPQHFPLPAIEPDRRNQAEPQQHPITSLLTAVSKPPMSPVGYNSQLEYADPAITTRKHEDDQRLDLFGTTEAPSAFSPTEGRAQSVNDLDVSVMMTKFCWSHAYLYATCVISDP